MLKLGTNVEVWCESNVEVWCESNVEVWCESNVEVWCESNIEVFLVATPGGKYLLLYFFLVAYDLNEFSVLRYLPTQY